MSETEYGRLAEKLDRISDKVVVIDEKLTGYGDLIKKTNDHENEIALIKQNCKIVQDLKAKVVVPWGNVKATIIGGVVVGLIMLAIETIKWLASKS